MVAFPIPLPLKLGNPVDNQGEDRSKEVGRWRGCQMVIRRRECISAAAAMTPSRTAAGAAWMMGIEDEAAGLGSGASDISFIALSVVNFFPFLFSRASRCLFPT